MRRAFALAFPAAVALAACVPALPEASLNGTAGAEAPSGTGGGSAGTGSGGSTGTGGSSAKGGSGGPAECAGCVIYILAPSVGGPPRNIAVDSTRLFWADHRNGLIMSLPTTGAGGAVGPPWTVHAPDSWIAVDAGAVYWSDSTPGSTLSTVIMKAVSANQPEPIVSDPEGIRQFAVANGAIYWTSGKHRVMKSDASGTPTPSVLAGDVDARAIAVDRGNVYFNTDRSFMKVSTAGGEPVLLANEPNAAEALAIDGRYVYWVATGSRPAGVMRLSVDGGPVEQFFTGPSPTSVAADATGVYWTNTDGTVRGAAAPGSDPRYVARTSYHSAFALALDASGVYWIAPNNTGVNNEVSIYKAPK